MTQNLPTEDETRRLAEDELELGDEEVLGDVVVDETIEEAEQAIREMEARERRRDGSYDTGGDDLSPGFDTDIDGNAPKAANRD